MKLSGQTQGYLLTLVGICGVLVIFDLDLVVGFFQL